MLRKILADRCVVQPAEDQIPDTPIGYALVHHDVCHSFDITQETCKGKPERGGILIGYRRGPHLEITDCTEPRPKDVASLTSFKRVDKFHQEAATKAWLHSNHMATYAGEWHSHPVGPPASSSVDRQTWRNVVARLEIPALFVVVAPSGWRAFRILGHGRHRFVRPLKQIEHGQTGIVFR